MFPTISAVKVMLSGVMLTRGGVTADMPNEKWASEPVLAVDMFRGPKKLCIIIIIVIIIIVIIIIIIIIIINVIIIIIITITINAITIIKYSLQIKNKTGILII